MWAQNFDDIHTLETTKLSNARFGEPFSEDGNREESHAGAINSYFLRMSFENRIRFLKNLSARIRHLGTIKILLNTFQAVGGKITSYVLTSHKMPMIYDRTINDHDRMLDSETLERTIRTDLEWYESLDDKEQLANLISLVRYSGGSMIRLFYENLRKIYAGRLRENVENEKNKAGKKESEEKIAECEHDLNDSKHKKVVELEKKWEEAITTLRKNVEKGAPKMETEKKSKGKGKKSKSSKKSKKKKEDEPLDYIQLMPIWIVKKIFNYLDKKTLNKAKKVNAYWTWAIGELLKDNKIQKLLHKTNKKLKEAAAGDCTLPDDFLKEPKSRISQTERRVRKLEKRGAVLENLRLSSVEASTTFALVVEAVKLSNSPYTGDVTMFPRVVRSDRPLYLKKPSYIIKDLNLICETKDLKEERNEETSQDTRFHLCSSLYSVSSDKEP